MEVVPMLLAGMLTGALVLLCTVAIVGAAAWIVRVWLGEFGLPALAASWFSLVLVAAAFLPVAASCFRHSVPTRSPAD